MVEFDENRAIYLPYWVEVPDNEVNKADTWFSQVTDYQVWNWVPTRNKWPANRDDAYMQVSVALNKGYKIPYMFLGLARLVGQNYLRAGGEGPRAIYASNADVEETIAKALNKVIRANDWDVYELKRLLPWDLYLEEPRYNTNEFYKLTVWGGPGSKTWIDLGVDQFPEHFDEEEWIKTMRSIADQQ